MVREDPVSTAGEVCEVADVNAEVSRVAEAEVESMVAVGSTVMERLKAEVVTEWESGIGCEDCRWLSVSEGTADGMTKGVTGWAKKPTGVAAAVRGAASEDFCRLGKGAGDVREVSL